MHSTYVVASLMVCRAAVLLAFIATTTPRRSHSLPCTTALSTLMPRAASSWPKPIRSPLPPPSPQARVRLSHPRRWFNCSAEPHSIISSSLLLSPHHHSRLCTVSIFSFPVRPTSHCSEFRQTCPTTINHTLATTSRTKAVSC